MRQEYRVSIVTPSFNQGAFLKQTIESVLAQDYRNIEYIIIDGGSTDESKDILASYSDRLDYWVSEPDRGQSHAIQKGFQKATGNVFAWLNSDDLLAPHAVATAISVLQVNPSIGLVYGDRLRIDCRGNVIGHLRLPSHIKSMFRCDQTIPQETAFFRRSVYERSGGINPALTFSMDFDLWCKMNVLTCFLHVPEYLGSFREHSGAKSVIFHDGLRGESFLAEHHQVFKEHFGIAPPGKFAKGMFRLKRKARLWLDEFSWVKRNNRYE